MISVLVRAEHGLDALAATLSALVPAVADGLLCDAVILTRAHDPAVEQVADAVGAGVVVDPDAAWAVGARQARRDWLLCLSAGDIPSEGWIRALDRFIATRPPRRFGRFRRPSGLGRFSLDLLGPPGIRAGDLVHKSLLFEGEVRRPARIAAAIERDPVFG
jgi:hypothetical protein